MPDCLNLEESEFKSKYGFEKPGKTENLATHCNKGGRAGKAQKQLEENGFSNVKVYSGFKDWKENNGKIEQV